MSAIKRSWWNPSRGGRRNTSTRQARPRSKRSPGCIVQRKGEHECGAVRLCLFRPYLSTMRLDYGAANREAHAHPLHLRRKKLFEYPLGRLYPCPIVADSYPNGIVLQSRTDFQGSVSTDCFKSIKRVAYEIDEHLLNLNPINADGWKVSVNIDINANIAPDDLLADEVSRFSKDAGDRHQDAGVVVVF